MARKASNTGKRKTRRRKSKVLDAITAEDALVILQRLAATDPDMAHRIEEAATELLRGLEVDEIADDVVIALESLCVEDVWDGAGPKSGGGYVDPGDLAWQMFENALQPFLDQMAKYAKLSMAHEAKRCCMGILQGIYDFHKKSRSEFKDWAVDAPGEYFCLILGEWRKSTKKRTDRAEMDRFLETHCPEWSAR